MLLCNWVAFLMSPILKTTSVHQKENKKTKSKRRKNTHSAQTYYAITLSTRQTYWLFVCLFLRCVLIVATVKRPNPCNILFIMPSTQSSTRQMRAQKKWRRKRMQKNICLEDIGGVWHKHIVYIVEILFRADIFLPQIITIY